MLAELSTKGLSENSDPQTIEQHAEVAIKGATVARNARLEMEDQIYGWISCKFIHFLV